MFPAFGLSQPRIEEQVVLVPFTPPSFARRPLGIHLSLLGRSISSVVGTAAFQHTEILHDHRAREKALEEASGRFLEMGTFKNWSVDGIWFDSMADFKGSVVINAYSNLRSRYPLGNKPDLLVDNDNPAWFTPMQHQIKPDDEGVFFYEKWGEIGVRSRGSSKLQMIKILAEYQLSTVPWLSILAHKEALARSSHKPRRPA